MRRVFKDIALQEKFDRDGFVVIPSFLDEQGINHLRDVFSKLNTEISEGFHVTNWSSNTEYRTTTDSHVRNVLAQKIKSVLDDYKPALGAFAVKITGQGSEMGLHQDWAITDESLYTSVSIWVPLVDVHETNGVLQVFPGSHQIFQNFRGQNIHFPFHNNDVQQLIKENYLENIKMKAGDALVLHHRIVHQSLPNHSGKIRLAAMLAMIPSEASVRHYYKATPFNQSGKVEVFECDDDFYIHFSIGEKPSDQKLTNAFYLDSHPFTIEQFEEAINQRKNENDLLSRTKL